MLTEFYLRCRKAFVAAGLVFISTFVANLTGQDVTFGAEPTLVDIAGTLLREAILPTIAGVLTGGAVWRVPNVPLEILKKAKGGLF